MGVACGSPMTAPDDPSSSAHDPELSKFLRGVEELSAVRHARGPDAFLHQVDTLGAELQALRKYRSDRVLSTRFEEYAAHRFALVDDASEYALAADEVLVLSIVSAEAPELVTRALQRSVSILSGVLIEEGVPALFGQLLKRLRDIARSTGDPALEHWLEGVVNALPGD